MIQFVKKIETNLMKIGLLLAALTVAGVMVFLYSSFLRVTQEIEFLSTFIEEASAYPEQIPHAEAVVERHETKLQGVPVFHEDMKQLFKLSDIQKASLAAEEAAAAVPEAPETSP